MAARDSDQQPLHMSQEGDSSPDRPPEHKTCTGYCCYRVLVTVYSILFLIIGICLLGVGAWVAKVKVSYESINDAATAPVILALVLGLFMVVFAFIGLFGTILEKLVLLKIFLGVAIIVFLGQVVVGILAFVYREEAINVINKQLRFAVHMYDKDDDIRNAVNYVQYKFSCCGLGGPADWELNPLYACDGMYRNTSCGVPDSCCKNVNPNCGLHTRNENTTAASDTVFGKGCTTKFRQWVEYNLDVVGGTALGLALLHVLGIFLVYLFITAVQDRVWLFKYRKRYYNNN